MLMHYDVDYCEADNDQTPKQSDSTGVTLYMKGHHQPSPMMHILHNALLQEFVGMTAKVKHVTWGVVKVRQIHMYDTDTQRLEKISQEKGGNVVKRDRLAKATGKYVAQNVQIIEIAKFNLPMMLQVMPWEHTLFNNSNIIF